MNPSDESDGSLRSLLSRMLDDGDLSDADRESLATAIQSGTDVQAVYVDWIILDELLGAEFPRSGDLEQELLPGVRAESGSANLDFQPRPANPVLGFLGTALHLSAAWLSSPKFLALAVVGSLTTYFVGLMISILISRAYRDDRIPMDRAEPPAHAPARIIAASDCRWQGSSVADLGTKLAAGTSRLAEGVVELEFDGGARVCIQGPAEFAPRTGQRLELTRGRLVAYVPKQARGFTVNTPTAEVIDLGTEFGVEVDGQGSTDLHVIRGRVEVKAASKAGVIAGQRQSITAGEAIHFSTDGQAPARIALDTTRFDTVRSSTPVTARSNRQLAADRSIWLGNLFDDPHGTPLAEALQTDTFRAEADVADLGVIRVVYGGKSRQEIAPGISFDFANLGWQEAPIHHHITNDAWSDGRQPANPDGLAGGIRAKGVTMGGNEPKIEEGIGMHADAFVTFDLDEIRATGGLEGRSLVFISDPSGINDSAFGHGGSIHLAALVSTRTGVRSAMVDGARAKLSKQDRHWSVTSAIGEPLRADGKFVEFWMPIRADDKYLTLISSDAGDGWSIDHGVWIGARLEVAR